MKHIAIAISLLVGAPAFGEEVLSFGQSESGASPIVGVESGGVTTITATDALIGVTSCLMCAPLTGTDMLTFKATSVGPAFMFHGFVVQNFAGTFSIVTSTGQNILSGSFTDATFGAGTSLTLSASNASSGETLNLTSSVMPGSELGDPKAMSLSLAAVTPMVGETDNSLSSFKASIAGTFSAAPTAAVPEPSTLPLLLTSLGTWGAWAVARFRRRRDFEA